MRDAGMNFGHAGTVVERKVARRDNIAASGSGSPAPRRSGIREFKRRIARRGLHGNVHQRRAEDAVIERRRVAERWPSLPVHIFTPAPKSNSKSSKTTSTSARCASCVSGFTEGVACKSSIAPATCAASIPTHFWGAQEMNRRRRGR